MSILVLEPTRHSDLMLFIELAKRLNVKFREEITTSSTTEQDAAFMALAGSLDTPESGDELVKIIAEAHHSKSIDINWTA